MKTRSSSASPSAFRLVITGNPGVGKHTSAKIIADEMKASIIDINKVALENNAILSKTEKGIEPDTKKIAKIISEMLGGKKEEKGIKDSNIIIVGHLAPYVVKSAQINTVAVLRRSPLRLEETLLLRNYTREKINENISSEILGISLYDSVVAFGKRKVAEFDTTGKTPSQTAQEIIDTIQKKKKPRRPGSTDWLAVISEEEVQRFFAY